MNTKEEKTGRGGGGGRGKNFPSVKKRKKTRIALDCYEELFKGSGGDDRNEKGGVGCAHSFHL